MLRSISMLACVAVTFVSAAQPALKSFTAYTRPMELSQGEVTNAFHRLAIPPGPIAVYRFSADVVEHDADGNVVPVPIYDAYLHHHVVGSNHEAYSNMTDQHVPMKPSAFSRSVGFGAGTESRGTPQEFYHPYAFVTVEGEDEWMANVHILNTRKLSATKAHECLECPCTSAAEFTADSVNGWSFAHASCNAELLAENNTVCTAATYHGGLRCCEDAALCLEKEELAPKEAGTSTYFLRYTLEYSEVNEEVRPLYLAGCCDASGDLTHYGNIEYDIPVCDPALHPGCVHTLSTKQHLDTTGTSVYALGQESGYNGAEHEVELVYAVGHQHRAGMGISMYNDATGELICASVPTYGTGEQVGNEKDYVVSMSTCTFNPPLRMKASDVVRVVSLYNNTMPHTGVMSIMYLALSDVESNALQFIQMQAQHAHPSATTATTLPSSVIAVIAVAVGVVALVLVVVVRTKQRSGYVPLARRS